MEDTGLSLLKQEMQCEEIHVKVNAIHRMKTVIVSIGPAETQASLIPYLEGKFAAHFIKRAFNPKFK